MKRIKLKQSSKQLAKGTAERQLKAVEMSMFGHSTYHYSRQPNPTNTAIKMFSKMKHNRTEHIQNEIQRDFE